MGILKKQTVNRRICHPSPVYSQCDQCLTEFNEEWMIKHVLIQYKNINLYWHFESILVHMKMKAFFCMRMQYSVSMIKCMNKISSCSNTKRILNLNKIKNLMSLKTKNIQWWSNWARRWEWMKGSMKVARSVTPDTVTLYRVMKFQFVLKLDWFRGIRLAQTLIIWCLLFMMVL